MVLPIVQIVVALRTPQTSTADTSSRGCDDLRNGSDCAWPDNSENVFVRLKFLRLEICYLPDNHSMSRDRY
jgi:hypothetical protein